MLKISNPFLSNTKFLLVETCREIIEGVDNFPFVILEFIESRFPCFNYLFFFFFNNFLYKWRIAQVDK